jgi:hypothetical protein
MILVKASSAMNRTAAIFRIIIRIVAFLIAGPAKQRASVRTRTYHMNAEAAVGPCCYFGRGSRPSDRGLSRGVDAERLRSAGCPRRPSFTRSLNMLLTARTGQEGQEGKKVA